MTKFRGKAQIPRLGSKFRGRGILWALVIISIDRCQFQWPWVILTRIVYYWTLIGSHIWYIEWGHFQWSWTTP